MIPKIIHYCWFGRGEKPELAKKCIASWEKYCPDYKIIEWNEDNFDVNGCTFTKEAYKAKKWAFVTDYVRLWAIVNYGGIYMDADVEVIRPLDRFLTETAFSGFQGDSFCVTGIMAGEKGFPCYRELLDSYETRSLFNKDGGFTPNTNIITDYFISLGFIPNGQKQTIAGYTVFPAETFCPMDFSTRIVNKSKDTYTIHWFDASWVKSNQAILDQYWQKNHVLARFVGKRAANYLVRQYYRVFKKTEWSTIVSQ